MISARRGPMPESFLRPSTVKRHNCLATRRAESRETYPFFGSTLPSLNAASDAAVPDVAIAIFTPEAEILCATRPTYRVTNPRSRSSSPSRGGSCRRNSLVSRTAPRGRLVVSLMCPCFEIVSSQLPPPRSIINTGVVGSRRLETSPRWIKRPSSWPEMMSTFQPVADRTHSRKACEFRASRNALVPTTRTRSAPARCAALWKRRKTLTVSAIASGERYPVRNANSPKRTTARSSRISTSRRP